MRTPTLFSPSITESLLPEVAGRVYQAKAWALAEKAGHHCQLTGYPYPALQPAPGQTRGSTYLMIEPRDKDASGQPMSSASVAQRLRDEGVTPTSTRMVCPLVFWSRHVDLALDYGKGDLIFAPWLSQGELITVFRTLCVAAAQPEGDHDIPVIRDAAEALQELTAQMGNAGVLSGLLALPENAEWDPKQWIETVKNLPSRERRVYMQRFGQHVRFMPNYEAFAPLGGYWAQTSHMTPNILKPGVGNAWLKRFQACREKVISA